MGKVVGAIVAIAVVVAIIVFAPELTPAFLTAAVGSTTAIAITTAVLSIAASLLLGLVFGGFGGLAKGAPKAEDAVGPPQIFRQAVSNSFIVYGKRRVGGLIVFFHSSVSGSDHFRYFVVAVAGHRCQGVISWMLGDEIVTVDGSNKVTSGKYANAAWLWFQRGLASETANSTFVSECGGNWTTNHKGNGVAAIYAKFQLTDAVIQAGMPNITAIIEGRDEIADPRVGTTGYSRNAALIFYDFMAMPREEGGFGAYDDEIPAASWISAQANVCDETVSGNPRYAIDAYITTGASPAEIRDSLIVNCAGSFAFSGGKHLMRVGYWNPVTANLSEDDLAGPIQVTPFFPADTAATQVQGTFIDPANGYQGQPFTTWTRPGAIDLRQLDLDLAFTTNRDQANRVAAIMGKRAACEKQVVWPMNISGLGLKAMQTVQLDASRYGLSNYAWVVSNWGLSADFSVVLSLREENAEIYDPPTPVSPSTPPDIVQPTGPTDPSTVIGIDDPVQRLTFKYDYLGTAQAGEFSRDITFKLNSNAGQITTGITWSFTILTGGINSLTSASGSQSMSGSGTGTMTVSTLDTSEAKVQISAAYNGKTYLKTITFTKDVAAAPVSGGSGGSGGSAGTLASKSSGFTAFTTTTFVDVTGSGTPLTGTMPAGVTTANINVTLDAMPASGTTVAKTVECKVMRDISGTPTIVGSVQSATSDWDSAIPVGDPASFSFSIADTGLTAGSTYNWRVYMRITSGTRTHNVTGTVSVTA